MGIISTAEVKRIARLARVRLTDGEIKQATNDLRAVLRHFAKIQAIDTADARPAEDVTGLLNVTRDDVIVSNELGKPQDLLNKAPDKDGGLVRVKAVFRSP